MNEGGREGGRGREGERGREGGRERGREFGGERRKKREIPHIFVHSQHSNLLNQSRLAVLKSRDDSVKQIVEEARQYLGKVTEDQPRYKKMLEDLIAQVWANEVVSSVTRHTDTTTPAPLPPMPSIGSVSVAGDHSSSQMSATRSGYSQGMATWHGIELSKEKLQVAFSPCRM